MFESSVNSDSIQTRLSRQNRIYWFESSVNSDSIQTGAFVRHTHNLFESSVNSDSIQPKFPKNYTYEKRT